MHVSLEPQKVKPETHQIRSRVLAHPLEGILGDFADDGLTRHDE